jgi:nitrite reductase/ring-hydroxylating ferredoxin subunit
MATCKINKKIIGNMADGEMKKITVSDMELIIVKRNGQYHALSGKCPHKGAPLEDGLLSKAGILCP